MLRLSPSENSYSSQIYIISRHCLSIVFFSLSPGASNPAADGGGAELFQCKRCPFSIAEYHEMKEHYRSSHGLFFFRCKYCQHATINEMSHKLQSCPLYGYLECEDCDYKTTDWSYLENHSLAHVRELEHPCFMCPYQSSQRRLLLEHRAGHGNHLLVFRCPYCFFGADSHQQAHKHILSLHGGKDSG